jgi:hypothetical protein
MLKSSTRKRCLVMSKLATVRTALRLNNQVMVHNVEEHLYLPEPNGYWTHTVDFIITPVKGLYSVEELQGFMMGLVPIEMSCKDDFRGGGEYLYFGKLYFDETIGTETVAGSRTIRITDPDVNLPDSFEKGEMIIDLGQTIVRMRRTWVRVYPDREYAKRAMENEDIYETRSFRQPRRSLSSVIKGH